MRIDLQDLNIDLEQPCNYKGEYRGYKVHCSSEAAYLHDGVLIFEDTSDEVTISSSTRQLIRDMKFAPRFSDQDRVNCPACGGRGRVMSESGQEIFDMVVHNLKLKGVIE